MNHVALIGNLTRDPDMRYTQSGTATCAFTIAVNRIKAKDGTQKTDYIPVVAWRSLAETCGRYLAKGRKVAVIGSIQTRTYDAKDGTKRYVTEVVASNVEFLSSKQQGKSQGLPDTDADEFVPADDEELPF